MKFGHRSPLALTALVLAGMATMAARRPPENCGCEVSQEAPAASIQPGAHDPTIVKDGKRFVLFVTGRGIPYRISSDLKNWSAESTVFAAPPDWAGKTIPGFRDHIWAPDVSRFGGRWHLYYSISTFGKNRSAIGHATNVTLDPTSKEFKWVDDGPVVQSYATDDFNAIDPNAVLDAQGTPWLCFGSFWNGIRLVKLKPDGSRADENKPIAIAARPHEGPSQPGAIEAPFIVRRGKFFYLFVSFDFCCRGVRSTYNVRVGRSESVQGPYVDREGKPMLDGGGTKVVESGTRWKGPGHEAVLHNGREDDLIYHAYDAQDNGAPKLQIAKITWDREGWPVVPPPE